MEDEGVSVEKKKIESSGFFIAQTTGVSLKPFFAGGDKEMKGRASPYFTVSSLQVCCTFYRLLFISDKANFISILQQMAPPSFQHACSRAHKGHFLNIVCSCYYQIHQKFKLQLNQAVGEHVTLRIQTVAEVMKIQSVFLYSDKNHTTTYGGRRLGCPVCSWQAVLCESLCLY